MTKISLVIVCGLPASGKTTLCTQLLSASDASHSFPFVFCMRGYQGNSNITDSCINSSKFSKEENSLCYIHVPYDELIPRNEQENYASLARSSSSDDGCVAKESQWKKARQSVLEMVEQLVLTLTNEALEVYDKEAKIQEIFHCSLSTASLERNSYVILIDDNFYYKSMRQEYYSLCLKHKVGFCTILMRSSVAEAVERNLLRPETERVPSEVIEQMAAKCDFANSGLEDQNCFHIDLEYSKDSLSCLKTKVLLESIFRRSLEAFLDNSAKVLLRNMKEKEAAESRDICSKNVLHQADNLLKKLVSDAVKNFRTGAFESPANVDVKAFVREANETRLLLREKLKQGIIVIPSCDKQWNSELNEFLQKEMAEQFFSVLTERLERL